ncbi:hypothetical protein F5Y15DRAFT_365332 [Xylariaceae sp. FL0016]|nr:hypothetical protein F5Y15DRAFT_365332 [Xylariaceae sp. FL0016]
MNCASDIVLAIPELLECILLHLSMVELLTLAPLTCKHWQSVIGSSVLIQQKLFFQPLKAPVAQYANTDEDAGKCGHPPAHTYNPLLKILFPPWFPIDEVPAEENDIQVSNVTRTHLTSLACLEPSRKAAFRRTGASWRRMLVRQPPVQVMGAIYRRQFPVESLKRAYVRFEDGLRMGAFYDFTLETVADDSTVRCVIWHASPNDQYSYASAICQSFERAGVILMSTSIVSARPMITIEGAKIAMALRSADFQKVVPDEDGEWVSVNASI